MDVLERGSLLPARDVRVPQVVVVVRSLDVGGYRLQPEALRRRLEALPQTKKNGSTNDRTSRAELWVPENAHAPTFLHLKRVCL